jgi:glucose/arabinose dehydrogenase
MSSQNDYIALTKRVSQGICLRRIASNLRMPVFATSHPIKPQVLLIAEKDSGRILAFNLDNASFSESLFLHVANISTGGERGLLGFANDPAFVDNGIVFVNCTNIDGDTEIRRYCFHDRIDASDTVPYAVVLKIKQPHKYHNGGWLGFSPTNGFLYIAMGDGGPGNDPNNRAQNPCELLGKMLRIKPHVNTKIASSGYDIPESNPFAADPSCSAEIWATGLRNPWRCSFDRLTGDLYIGDVGQDRREEINFESSDSQGGNNYGWRSKEGSLSNTVSLDDAVPRFTVDPLFEYGRDFGRAVIGGYCYRGSSLPGLVGSYIFGDMDGVFWLLRQKDGVLLEVQELTLDLLDNGFPVSEITSFAEDAYGELYVLTAFGEVFSIMPKH